MSPCDYHRICRHVFTNQSAGGILVSNERPGGKSLGRPPPGSSMAAHPGSGDKTIRDQSDSGGETTLRQQSVNRDRHSSDKVSLVIKVRLIFKLRPWIAFEMLMSYGSVSPDLIPPGPGLSTLKSQFMETEAWHSFIQVSFDF